MSSIERGPINCTLMLIKKEEIIEGPDGEAILPKPYKLMNVHMDGNFLAKAILAQRQCLRTGESYLTRLFDEDHPEEPEIFATDILTEAAIFTVFTTNDERGN